MTVDELLMPRPFVVRDVRRELTDVWSLDLEIAAGNPLADGAPGQFNMVWVFGLGEVPISISQLPGDGGPLVHTVRAVGNVTRAICAARPGDVLGLRGPFGSSWPLEAVEGRDVVIMAGGIGLAPLRPAIHHLIDNRERYGRIAILYGTRSPDVILFDDEIDAWRGLADIHVAVSVDAAAVPWSGHVGPVTQLVPGIPFSLESAVAFLCGPEVMMQFGIRALCEAGMNFAGIYLSMERNMKCAVGFCGHCQLGPEFVCKSGPVYCYDRIRHLLAIREL